MIKIGNGEIECSGNKVIILAEYMKLTKVLREKIGDEAINRAFMSDDTGGNLMVIGGRVLLPDNPEYTMINLAFILNAITRLFEGKSEIIIKSAADLAMRLKPDGEEVDLEDMLMAFDKALKEMDGEDV